MNMVQTKVMNLQICYILSNRIKVEMYEEHWQGGCNVYQLCVLNEELKNIFQLSNTKHNTLNDKHTHTHTHTHARTCARGALSGS